MSVGKVSSGQEGYYLSAVAHGAEDYYSERGEVPGRWVGSAAGELGLAGDVDDDAFRAVLSGADPSTGVRLRRANGRVCAFDLTLSAPKSVSVLWALGDAEMTAGVVAAHELAVDAAVGYMQREAVRSRRGHDGVETLAGGGLIGAAFRHRTSRAGDPQLHAHVVVANTTRCEDGVWRTLDGRHLYAHARTAGFLYQAELRHALSQSFGLEWEPATKGVGEVAGVPHEVLREFSRRRIQIEAAMDASGDTSIPAARRLAVKTRKTKDYDVDPAAGTGKTYALGVARQAWEQDGHPVIGCALSARAAQELQTGAGIQSSTLHLLLVALDRPQSRGLSPGTVVVVDEAAMVGTVQLARLCEYAARDRAKVVLVGDHHQLPAIEAGGAFTAIGARLGAVHLTDNQRQTDPIEREALNELRDGDVNRALQLLDSIGHVECWEYGDTVNRRIVGDWLPAALDGDDAIMLASTRADVGELNEMARYGLIARGHVAPTGLDIDGQTFAVGDRVMTLKNDRRLQLINGERGSITTITDHDIVVRFDNRHQPTRIPTGYLEDGGLDHAYAMTIHKAQGLTCDSAFVLGDELLHREAAYTALSRGRHENKLYTVLPGKYDPHLLDPVTVEATMNRALEQSVSKNLARDRLEQGRSVADDYGIDIGL
ncbi:MAG: MobF family relaxase [Acidimicrobiia bacterium]